MKKILIIAEERSIRLALNYSLKEAGFKVFSVGSISEGQQLIQSNIINLIIINYSESLKNALKIIFSSHIPFVFITDLFGLPQSIQKSIPEFTPIFKFPFSMNTLISEMGSFLEKTHVQTDAGKAPFEYQGLS